MSSIAPIPEASSADDLTKLCQQRQWQTVIEHVRANPSNAKAVAEKGNIPPLHAACSNGAPIQVIKALLNANPSAAQAKSGIHDRLPLHCLLASPLPVSDTVVAALVEAFPGACRVSDKNGCLPIHLACQAAPVSDDIFTSILSMYPEGAYARNFAGMYPLHIAAANKDTTTKKTALAALDRGTLYASISKMTAIRLSKEHEAKTMSLEKGRADKLNKMEARAKEERSKLKAQIDSLKSQLKDEKEGSQKLNEQIKTMSVQHEENIAEQAKASDMEKAEVQLKNMDLLLDLETVQGSLDASNDKVSKQSEEVKGLEQSLEDTAKTLSDTNKTLESLKKVLAIVQGKLTSAEMTNEDKSKYILQMKSSLKVAQESVLALVKEQERMNASMVAQKDALRALLLGHDTSINDASVLTEKMVGLASDIGKATKNDAENNVAVVEDEEKKEG